MLSPLLRAATLLGPSLLICCLHLSVLLIKQSVIKLLLQCLPLVSPLPKQGSTVKQREQPGSAASFGNMMVLVPERARPLHLRDYATLQLVVHQNPESDLTQ